MFIGNYAPALVAAVHPKAPRLGALFVAAQLVDIAFFLFALVGVEHFRLVPGFTATNALDLYDMRFTHSLLGTLAFAAAWAVGTRLRGGGWTTAWIGAAVVASHWPIDWLVHAPDLTVAGIGQRHGLALWNRPRVEMPLELGLIALAAVFYATRTRARGWRGHITMAILAGLLLTVQLVDWLSPQPDQVVDPPPSSLPLIALLAFALLATAAWSAARFRTRAVTHSSRG